MFLDPQVHLNDKLTIPVIICNIKITLYNVVYINIHVYMCLYMCVYSGY